MATRESDPRPQGKKLRLRRAGAALSEWATRAALVLTGLVFAILRLEAGLQLASFFRRSSPIDLADPLSDTCPYCRNAPLIPLSTASGNSWDRGSVPQR